MPVKYSFYKKGEENFDVAQGAYDSAEVCDIVGLFLLSEVKKLKLNANLGIYRDDGLGVSNSTPRQIDQIKKKICEVYRKHGLSLKVEQVNKKVVQFLDVEFDLENDSYRPFIKENDVPLYVHQKSNHPPAILKNIPKAVNKRLSALSSSKEMFDSVSQKFQQALNNAGYSYNLKFDPEGAKSKKKRTRKRNDILWFNPPYSTSIKTNVGAQFLKLVSKHFPKSHVLHKLINRKTVKMSYRNSPNMKKIISAHNQKVMRKSENPVEEAMCNCKKYACPLEGKCQTNNMVYQATVKSETDKQTYIGLTATTFKKRWANHQTSFDHQTHRKNTSLSKYIWQLKDSRTQFSIEWKIIGRAKPFSPISNICSLCTLEKWHILFTPDMATLNKKDELNNYCLHKRTILLDKT